MLNILLVQIHLPENEKMEDETSCYKRQKTLFSCLKTDSNSVLFSEEKIDTRFSKNLKNQNMLRTP